MQETSNLTDKLPLLHSDQLFKDNVMVLLSSLDDLIDLTGP